jgi:hypothetical protein
MRRDSVSPDDEYRRSQPSTAVQVTAAAAGAGVGLLVGGPFGAVAGSRVPITGVVHRPVSPRADTGPFVSRFSAHTASELVTNGPVSAAAGFTP